MASENNSIFWMFAFVLFFFWILTKHLIQSNAVTQNQRICAQGISTPAPGQYSIVPIPTTKPAPIFNSPQALATPTPALCAYNRMETTAPTSVVSTVISANPLSLLKYAFQCFCKVNTLYGQALAQGVASGKICRNFPTPARCASQLRTQLNATSGVRRAALGCLGSSLGTY